MEDLFFGAHKNNNIFIIFLFNNVENNKIKKRTRIERKKENINNNKK
jgi:hypothetical protein